MSEPFDTAFAAAYREAERVRAEAEAARLRALEVAARAEWDAPIYDPFPYRDAFPDPRMFDGTGIGALYGLPGSQRFLPELGDWDIVAGSDRP